MTQYIVAIGGNVPGLNGSIQATLEAACKSLAEAPEVRRVGLAPWYRTPAFPPGSGPDFVNGAAIVEADIAAHAMLEILHQIEHALGRTRTDRWEPRICDLDLIAAEEQVLPDRSTVQEWMALDRGKAQTLVPPRLILPHPRMHERAFVLIPVRDVAPEWRHPILGTTVTEMIDRLEEGETASVVPIY